jgi:hypothetical protein
LLPGAPIASAGQSTGRAAHSICASRIPERTNPLIRPAAQGLLERPFEQLDWIYAETARNINKFKDIHATLTGLNFPYE